MSASSDSSKLSSVLPSIVLLRRKDCLPVEGANDIEVRLSFLTGVIYILDNYNETAAVKKESARRACMQ